MVIGEVGLGEICPACGANRQAPHRSREAWLQTKGDFKTDREGLAADGGDGRVGGGESG